MDIADSRGTDKVVTKEDIKTGLRAVGLCEGDTVFVHFSLSCFGYVEGGADTVIDSLPEPVGTEVTVVMPAFTRTSFHDNHRITLDPDNTPSETARITEVFGRPSQVRRNTHICHSVVATGR